MHKIPMSPEAARTIKKQLRAFRKKFHRDAGPDDPMFFDPEVDTPQPYPRVKLNALLEEMVAAGKKAGIPPDLLYAMQKTGLMVTEQNKALLSEEDLAQWNTAIAEFRSLQ
jgi:integrase